MGLKNLIGKYNNSYLDHELLGIFQHELVLIGARSGAGKTTIANQIALANSDKKVSLFSLENFEGDLLLFEMFKEYKRLCADLDTVRYMTFRKFCLILEDEIVKKARKKAKDKIDKINIIYRKPDGFNITDMQNHFVEEARKGCEMIIVDHIDYFDMHRPRENENQNISEIMKEIRKLQDVYHIPVVLISHLRKGTRETVIPTLEDFMGTSNKVKEATTVVLFAPDDEANEVNVDGQKNTWICIRKDRMNGYRNTACNIVFNPSTLSYEEDFTLHKVNYWGTKTELLGGENGYI